MIVEVARVRIALVLGRSTTPTCRIQHGDSLDSSGATGDQGASNSTNGARDDGDGKEQQVGEGAKDVPLYLRGILRVEEACRFLLC